MSSAQKSQTVQMIPEDVALEIARLLSFESTLITGQVIRLDHGNTNFSYGSAIHEHGLRLPGTPGT